MNSDYTQEAYVKQFTIRIPNLIAKYDRVEAIYKAKVSDTPKLVYTTFDVIRGRLREAQAKYGDIISPLALL